MIETELQWLQDWLIRSVGTSVNAESGRRKYPPSVKTESMIPKVLSKEAHREMAMARAAQAAGHRQTAIRLYEAALKHFFEAQINIFRDIPTKRQLMELGQRCMDEIIQLARHKIERINIPFEGGELHTLLHAGNEDRPLLLYIPGMDGSKETSSVGALASPLLSRNFRVLAMDGPGQGTTRCLGGMLLRPNAYAGAVKAALDHLEATGRWDGKAVYVLGSSMGSRWGMEAAALDPRIKGLACIHVAFGQQRRGFSQAPPRFRKVLGYMTGLYEEQALLQFMDATDLSPDLRVDCPTFVGIGEFDPLTPLSEARYVFVRNLRGPKILFVYEDAFHGGAELDALCGLSSIEAATDWLQDCAAGKVTQTGEFYISAHEGPGIYAAQPLADNYLEI